MASEYLTTKLEHGTVNISDEVVASATVSAVMNTEGIAGLVSDKTLSTEERVSKKEIARGIRVEFQGNEIVIDCSVVITYGSVVSDIARNVQENVVRMVEDITGETVKSVNINICGISTSNVK